MLLTLGANWMTFNDKGYTCLFRPVIVVSIPPEECILLHLRPSKPSAQIPSAVLPSLISETGEPSPV